MNISRKLGSGRRRGGIILAFTLALALIASISAVYLTQTLIDQQRINERRRNLWRAFLHAEGGIAQVQHWAMHPGDYTPDTSLWAQSAGTTFSEKYPTLESELNAGGIVVVESVLDSMGITGFTTETGWSLGRIDQISILPLDGSEPASAAGSVFKIIALGSAGNPEVQREVTGYATMEPFTSIQLPAPLISMSTAATGGNPKIHWGEAWSKHSFDMNQGPSKNHMGYIFTWSGNTPTGYSDQYAKYRTEGAIAFDSTWSWDVSDPNVFGSNSNNNDLYSDYLNQAIVITGDWQLDGRRPGRFDNDASSASAGEIWADVFYTHVPPDTLPWPDLASEYSTFKALAQANGRYYTTDSSGQILKDGTVIDFDIEFGGADLDLAFIDTIDGNPPVYDTSDPGYNLATISVQGNSLGLKGFYYLNANFEHQGQGNPPDATGTNPNSNSYETISKVWLDGVLYTAGTMDFHANTTIFGSAVTEGGFIGQGTPDIYYNTELADGLDLGGGNLGSPFRIQLHNNSAP